MDVPAEFESKNGQKWQKKIFYRYSEKKTSEYSDFDANLFYNQSEKVERM